MDKIKVPKPAYKDLAKLGATLIFLKRGEKLQVTYSGLKFVYKRIK